MALRGRQALWLAGGLGGAYLLGRALQRPSSVTKRRRGNTGGGSGSGGSSGGGGAASGKIPQWIDQDAPRRIRELAYPIELHMGWPGLADFLVAVALWESRGVSDAVGDNGTSFGWFQLKRKSSRAKDAGVPLSALRSDERAQVALAAWYAYRLSRPAWWPPALGTIPWLAIRRGWKFPKLVKDVDEVHADSRAVRHRFSRSLVGSGLAPTFMYEPAFGPAFVWQGIDAALEVVGYGAVS